jgi:uncharacterized protein YkwD
MKLRRRFALLALLPLLAAFAALSPTRGVPLEAASTCPIARADLNGDGTVTTADLSLAASRFLQPSTAYDQNGDGKITTADPAPGGNQTLAGLPALEATMFTLHNQARATAGLPALVLDSRLTQVARERSKDMADNNYFSHYRPGETTAAYVQILNADGIAYSWAGENIAWNLGYSDAQSVQQAFTAWMNSQGHRDNILRAEFTNIGIGAYRAANGALYYTAVFMTPR